MARKLCTDYEAPLRSRENVPYQPEMNEHASEMSEYERMVWQKRQKKEAFLESLQINEAKQSFQQAVQIIKPKPLKTLKRPKTPKAENVVRRKSRRLENLEALDYSEKTLGERAVEEAMKKDTELFEKIPANLPFENALVGGEVFENFSSEFDNLDIKAVKPCDDHVSQFSNMNLYEDHIAKVVFERITALAVHPSTEKIIICAGSKYGKIGFWNVNSDVNPFVFNAHCEGITDLKFNPFQNNVIVSSSYDGTLRCGDFESKVFHRVFDVSEETTCTSFDFLSSNTYLVSHQKGMLSVVDARSSQTGSGKRHHCHDYNIKTVSIHPVDKNYFLTSDVKGIMRLWDLRKLQSNPLVDVRHHQRSINSAYFSPLTGKSVLTTSQDDTICIFDSSNLGKSLTFQSKLKHNNHTGRWLSVFKATWLPNSDDAFVVGSMDYPRRIEFFNDHLDTIYELKNELLSSITSRHAFHPSLPVLAGGNSSGKVFVFTSSEL